jgi:hypothetical protein
MSYRRRGYGRWHFPKLNCPDLWNSDTVVSWLIVEWRIRRVSVNRRVAGQKSMRESREYKQISSKGFHGELRFVKNSVNSVLLELKPVNFQSGVPDGTVLPPNHHFSIRGSAVIYN